MGKSPGYVRDLGGTVVSETLRTTRSGESAGCWVLSTAEFVFMGGSGRGHHLSGNHSKHWDILSTCPNIPNYMPAYYGPVPAWSPAFLPYPVGNQYPINIQHDMEPLSPLINRSSATSRLVGSDDNRLDGVKTDSLCTSRVEESNEDRSNPRETDDGNAGSSQNVDCDDMIEEPKSVMEFNSLEDLINYYKQYGKKCGFEVMTKKAEKGDDETVRYVTLVCARGGKAQNRILNVANPHPTGKTECKAKINTLKSEGKFQLTTVHNIHNHCLSPKKSRFFRCNRKVSDALKRVLDTNDMAGIRMNKSFGSLVVGAGGFGNLPFLEKDCRNYIDKARHLRFGASGAGALQQYFLQMQYKNPGFFALMDLDDEGRLKNVFWCMDGIAPKAIRTDQDRAMKNAIAIVFPNRRHRFCLWHILQKVPEKLGSYGSYKSGMKNDLMKCVYDTQSVEEFEECWEHLIITYNLHENVWLQSLYAECEHWTNSKEFVDQFENALKKKFENENTADFHTFNVTIPCISRSPIEKRFQDLYTNTKFKEVQQQVTGIIDMDPKLLKTDGSIKTYLVEDEVRLEEFTKLVTHYVDFSEEDTFAKCSCGLFEMGGILCRHVLAVFKCNEIKSLPDRYILD
ncbi:protein FAR1-RELATED SEQUENCE 5-like [Juglans microcarpa x Juglans regia]|uniref:protein FAR1-RELATED SEQUENCE 5-like n=1 Tax=Juglans microcarpa x Juglans regia TaxID=2249226 RepID=UPI001B7F7541|nr:protein FAR1-RELATED SEQUENCE 5-like [Juglans microcarpa x Juglans regia]